MPQIKCLSVVFLEPGEYALLCGTGFIHVLDDVKIGPFWSPLGTSAEANAPDKMSVACGFGPRDPSPSIWHWFHPCTR